jgi:hypothetical protein
MRIFNVIPMLHLQLFAEGSAGAGGNGAAGQGTGDTGAAAVSQTGENAPAAEVTTEPQPQVDLDAEFAELIKGKYKDQHNKVMQNIVRERLKGNKETVDKFNTLSPVLELLGKKYGVDATNIQALADAIEDDDSLYEEAALENGTSPKDEKRFSKLTRQNQQLLQQINDRKQKEQADQQMQVWEQQASEARKTYPNLDLNVEAKNPQFRQLLFAGIDVGTAYLAVHKDDVLSGAMRHAAQTMAQKVTNNIIANGNRPAENGMAGQSAAITKSDPSLMTKAERQALIQRSARGETIRF